MFHEVLWCVCQLFDEILQTVSSGVEEVWERRLEEHIKELCDDSNTDSSS